MIKKRKLLLNLLTVIAVTVLSYSNVNAEELYVEYTGNADKVFMVSDDFFVNNSSLLPGDIVEDTVSLKNSFSRSVKYYFKTEPLSSQEYDLDEDYELLDKIGLKITSVTGSQETVVYDGQLGSKDFTEFKELGTIKSGEDSKLNFQLSVPAELTNRFDMTRTKVKWVFGITDEDGNEIRTGDTTNSVKYIITGTFALIMFVFFYQKRNDEENTDRKESEDI